jgi:ankyrin repeat protein
LFLKKAFFPKKKKMNVTWGELEATEGVSSNLWRTEREQHGVFIIQRHVLLSSRHRIVLKLPRQPLICAVQNKDDAAKIEALLVQIYTAESMRVGSYRFSDMHLRRFLARQLVKLRLRTESSGGAEGSVASGNVGSLSVSGSAFSRRTSIGGAAAASTSATNANVVVVNLSTSDRDVVPASIAALTRPLLTYKHLRDVQDQREFLALVNACRQCDVSAAQQILTDRARRIASALLRGEREAHAVLSNVALLNTVSEQGTTLPLIAARAIATDSTGKTVDDASRMITLLLQNRCDVNGCTEIGWTLLHEASSGEGSGALLQWLIDTYAGPLLETAGASAVLPGLLRHKSVDRRLAVPQMQTLQAHDGDGVEALVQADSAAGASAAEQRRQSMALAPMDANGWTPLHHACSVGNLKSVQMLIDAGAPALALTNNCELPLHFFLKSYAVGATSGLAESTTTTTTDNEYVAVLRRVIELTDTTSLNMADIAGVTPFMVACASCPVEVVRLLLPYADFSLVKANGETALHDAVRGGSADVCGLLLGHGKVDATVRASSETSHGLTALELARDARHGNARTEQVVMLLQAAEVQHQHSRSVSVAHSRRGSGDFSAVALAVTAASSGDSATSDTEDAVPLTGSASDGAIVVASLHRRGSAALPEDMQDDLYRVPIECETVLDTSASDAAAASSSAAAAQASFDAIVDSTQASASDEPLAPSNVVLDSIPCRLLSATPAVFGRLVLTQNELQFRPRLALRNIYVPYTNILSVQRREDAATLAVEIKRRDGQVRELLFGDLQPHLSLPVGVSGGHSVGSAVVDALQQQHQAFVSTLGVGPSQEAVAQARVGAAELGHVLTHLVSAGADGVTGETVASIRWPVDQTAFRRLLLTSQRDGAIDDGAATLRWRHECRLAAHGRTVDGLLLVSRDFIAFAERGELDDGAFARAIRFECVRELAVRELKVQSRRARREEARLATATGSSGVQYDGSHSLVLAMGASADRWRLEGLPLVVCEGVRELYFARHPTAAADAAAAIAAAAAAVANAAAGATADTAQATPDAPTPTPPPTTTAPADEATIERVCVADALSWLGVRIVATLSQAGMRLSALIGIVSPELVDDAHDLVWQLRAHGAHVVSFVHDDAWRPDVFDLAEQQKAAAAALSRATNDGGESQPVLFDDIGHGSPLHVTARDDANLRRSLQRATGVVFVNAFETLNGGTNPVPLVKRLLALAEGSGRLRRIVKLSPIGARTVAPGTVECENDGDFALCHAVAEECVRQYAASVSAEAHVVQHAPTMQYVLRRVSQQVCSRLEVALPLAAEANVPYVHEADVVACVLGRFVVGSAAATVRVCGPHAVSRSALAEALGDVCRLQVAVRVCTEDEWLAGLIGGDRSTRVATVEQALRLGGWLSQCSALYSAATPVACDVVGAETLRSFLERCAPQRCVPKRRCYFRLSDVREMHATFETLSGGAPRLTLPAFRGACGVVFDDDDLCERVFGLFEWVDSNGKARVVRDPQQPADVNDEQRAVSFEAWLSVWSVLVLGDTFEQLDLAWRLLDQSGSGTCTYHDVRRVAEWSHRALRRLGLGVTEPAWAAGFYASLRPTNGLAERSGFVRAILAGRLDVLNDETDAESRLWQDEVYNLRTLVAILQRRPRLPFGARRSLRSVPVLPGTQLWSLASHVMLGVLRAVGEAESSCIDREDDGDDLDDGTTAAEQEERTLSLGRDVRTRLGGEAYRCDYHIVDCAPVLFRRLRAVYGRDCGVASLRSTALSLDQLMHHVMWQGAWSGLAGATTTGRSGSLFWRTGDSRFLLKTLKPSEEVLLRRFVPFFVTHFERCYAQSVAHPSTSLPSLLSQICGLYRMTASAREPPVTLIVMRNVFRHPIEAQYDLKGSTVGRSVGAATADMARKDLDFGARRINIGARRRALVLSQIERDSLLLEQLNLCDYSLLLGARHATPAERRAGLAGADALGRLPCGGWLSECTMEVYYFAIIDLLTPYDLKKIGEFAFKSVVHGGGISVQPPRRYRLRFQKYMATIFA